MSKRIDTQFMGKLRQRTEFAGRMVLLFGAGYLDILLPRIVIIPGDPVFHSIRG